MTSPHHQPLLFSIEDVIEALIKAQGIHEGLFCLSVTFNIGIGDFGPTQESLAPGVSACISRLGLQQVQTPGPHTVNAAQVNPAPQPRKRKQQNP